MLGLMGRLLLLEGLEIYERISSHRERRTGHLQLYLLPAVLWDGQTLNAGRFSGRALLQGI